MKLLLDTHTLLWSIGKSDALSEKAKQAIKDGGNEILVSAVSLWEIALKHSIGKLITNINIKNIPEYCKKMEFVLIPLEPADALNCLRLPPKNSHKDPFDRMLIYQCIANEYTLVSKDRSAVLYKENGLK